MQLYVLDEIAAKDVNIDDIREKVKKNKVLSSIGEKKVIDKVRSLFKKADQLSLEEISEDTSEEKMERMLHSDLESTEVSEKPSAHCGNTKGFLPQRKLKISIVYANR